jgi:SAM-dependent methyltransferase
MEAWGVDLNPGKSDRLLSGDAAELPFGSSSFEGVLFECSLSAMEDPDAALVEAARVLVPSGVLYVADLYAPKEPKELFAALGRAEGCETLFRRFSESGFRLLDFEDRSRDLISLWAALLFEGAIEGVCRPPSDFRVGYFIAALEKANRKRQNSPDMEGEQLYARTNRKRAKAPALLRFQGAPFPAARQKRTVPLQAGGRCRMVSRI